jgi:Mg-chelatase subunit ChlD
MADNPANAVIFLLDRTGSMERIKATTIESFNAYLAELRERPEIEFSLLQFDSTSTDVVHFRAPVGEVPNLTPETFQPRHSTPLIDAAVITIRKARDVYKPQDKVVIMILTDGHENASIEHRMADLAALVKEATAWGWQFVFLGAGMDAYADAGRAGIRAAKTVSFNAAEPEASRRTYRMVARKSRDFFSAPAGSAAQREISFSDEEKDETGDRYRRS